MSIIMMNGTAWDKVVYGEAGKQCFCQACAQYTTCDHNKARISETSRYVLRYVFAFEDGIKMFPNGGTWEDQPEWFDKMLSAGRNEYKRCINDLTERELKKQQQRSKRR